MINIIAEDSQLK